MFVIFSLLSFVAHSITYFDEDSLKTGRDFPIKHSPSLFIGKVMGEDGHGTGTLISNRFVLTARHVVEGEEDLLFYWSHTYFSVQEVRTRKGDDIAVLVLSKAIEKIYMPLLPNSEKFATFPTIAVCQSGTFFSRIATSLSEGGKRQFVMSGYGHVGIKDRPHEKTERLHGGFVSLYPMPYKEGLAFSKFNAEAIVPQAFPAEGDSGAPLFMRTDTKNPWKIVGIAIGKEGDKALFELLTPDKKHYFKPSKRVRNTDSGSGGGSCSGAGRSAHKK